MAEHAEHSDGGHGAEAHNPLDPNELFNHVADSPELHIPRFLTPDGSGHVEIPQPFKLKTPLFTAHTGKKLIDDNIKPLDFPITKFMVIELVVAILMCIFFVGLAKAIKGGALPGGRFRGMLEAMLLYFRDNVARPCI